MRQTLDLGLKKARVKIRVWLASSGHWPLDRSHVLKTIANNSRITYIDLKKKRVNERFSHFFEYLFIYLFYLIMSIVFLEGLF